MLRFGHICRSSAHKLQIPKLIESLSLIAVDSWLHKGLYRTIPNHTATLTGLSDAIARRNTPITLNIISAKVVFFHKHANIGSAKMTRLEATKHVWFRVKSPSNFWQSIQLRAAVPVKVKIVHHSCRDPTFQQTWGLESHGYTHQQPLNTNHHE